MSGSAKVRLPCRDCVNGRTVDFGLPCSTCGGTGHVQVDDPREVVSDLLEALTAWLSVYDGWSDEDLWRRCDPATRARIKQTRAAIARADPDYA